MAVQGDEAIDHGGDGMDAITLHRRVCVVGQITCVGDIASLIGGCRQLPVSPIEGTHKGSFSLERSVADVVALFFSTGLTVELGFWIGGAV